MQLLRVALGVLAVLFALALGRMAARLRGQKQPYSKALTWVLRISVCVLAVLWRQGLDATSIATLALVAVAFGAGVIVELRPKHVEEIHLFRE